MTQYREAGQNLNGVPGNLVRQNRQGTVANSDQAASSAAAAAITATYGTGAPAGSAAEGALYFDTTLPIYAGYIYHSAAWHQF